ncbi:hypothetical protein [Ferrimonas marina]|uniref:Uncharacterized protein n=1 Tax=Ferrimonas marina TaxID=299255 RepID=A0A1M5ZGH3_9GAMM|nr:hypothetical protein [Ferrimonas marina]SHI23337.1 hypothetical protein SAMN02745129_0293 [Ferrimonas marina]
MTIQGWKLIGCAALCVLAGPLWAQDEAPQHLAPQQYFDTPSHTSLASTPTQDNGPRLVPVMTFGQPEQQQWFIGTQVSDTQPGPHRPEFEPQRYWQARFGGGLNYGRASFVLDLSHSQDLPLADQLGLALTAKYEF